jgi:radical SAM protein with 4Fe4S-binding SPASM domain
MMHSPLRFLPSILTKRPPVHLTLFVTRRCNARCPFCFYSAGEASGDELSLDEYSRISRSMGSLLWLAFSGGEPILRDDLMDIAKVFHDNNRPSIILIPTNGLMPGRTRVMVEQILNDCPKSTVVVKLSIDGPRELHDSLRGVGGAFDRTLETYELLAPLLADYRNFELGVNTVFCAENQDHMDGIIGIVAGMKDIRTHTISLCRGQRRKQSGVDIDLSKYLDASRRLAKGLREGSQPSYGFRGARLKAAQDIIQRRLIHETAVKNSRRLECYAGRLNLVITETGELYPCESFLDEHKLGNLRENDFDINAMLRKEGTRHIIDRIGRHCFCTHECYMMTNILFNPRLYPSLLKEYLWI